MEKRGIKGLLLMAATGAVAAVLVSCVFGLFRMQGIVMEPSIKDNSIILINKLAYFYREPEEGDVVAFRCNVYSEDGEGSLLIRRVTSVTGSGVVVSGDTQDAVLDSSDQAVGVLRVDELEGKVCFR